LFATIQRCLEKDPGKRYQSFKELRASLELLLKRQTGETVGLPEPKASEVWEWYSKAASLQCLGRSDEAIVCLDRAIELSPRHEPSWCSKGIILHRLGR
jgi:tetratricopeptide (TPR) repeat protein